MRYVLSNANTQWWPKGLKFATQLVSTYETKAQAFDGSKGKGVASEGINLKSLSSS